MLGYIKSRAALLSAVTATLFVAGAGLTAGSASAAADPVSDAFGDMQDKVVLYGGLIVSLVVASIVLFLGIKYLRKGVSKA